MYRNGGIHAVGFCKCLFYVAIAISIELERSNIHCQKSILKLFICVVAYCKFRTWNMTNSTAHTQSHSWDICLRLNVVTVRSKTYASYIPTYICLLLAFIRCSSQQQHNFYFCISPVQIVRIIRLITMQNKCPSTKKQFTFFISTSIQDPFWHRTNDLFISKRKLARERERKLCKTVNSSSFHFLWIMDQ